MQRPQRQRVCRPHTTSRQWPLEEAQRFCNFSQCDDTQVFITSHSPAFYLAETDADISTRRFFIDKQANTDDSIIPANAVSPINSLDSAEQKMEQAGLLQLPFVIRSFAEQKEALAAVTEDAEKLRNDLLEIEAPTLYLEGVNDKKVFQAAFERLGVDENISIKTLGGTPKSLEALFSSVLANGGISSNARTLFLFDNDKAGRASFKKLKGNLPAEEPMQFSTNVYSWVLPFTEEFKSFMKEFGILPDQAFFTAEFLYPENDAIAVCDELVSATNSEEIDSWKLSVNGDYWNALKQPTVTRLLTADALTRAWFYSRGVPNGIKGSFATEIENRVDEFVTIDGIAAKVSNLLLNNE